MSTTDSGGTTVGGWATEFGTQSTSWGACGASVFLTVNCEQARPYNVGNTASSTLVESGGVRRWITDQPRDWIIEDILEGPDYSLKALLAMQHRGQP